MVDVLGPTAFDFAGALDVARRLVALAAAGDTLLGDRRSAYGRALLSWTGPARDLAAEQVRSQHVEADAARGALRAEAGQWAAAWALAADRVQRQRWAAAAAISGEAVVGAPPLPVPIPMPPDFAPTVQVGPPGFDR